MDAALEAAAQSALGVSAPAAVATAAAPAVSAPPAATPAAAPAVAALPATVAATAAVPAAAVPAPAAGAAAATPLPDPPHAAPALVTDFPPPRQLSIQIPRSVVVLLPLAGLALYLLVSLLPKPATSLDSTGARAELAAPEQQTAPAPAAVAAESDATDDGAADAEHAAAEPELAPAELARLRERTRQAQQLSEARERVKVTLFYTERCPHCSEARGYLTAHGVRAEQIDIDKDPKARARYLRLNPKGSLPTLVVEKQVLAGFDADRLEHAIDRAARARLAPAPKKRKH